MFFLGGEGLLLTGWLVHRNPPKSPNVDRETSHEKIVGVVRFAHLTRWWFASDSSEASAGFGEFGVKTWASYVVDSVQHLWTSEPGGPSLGSSLFLIVKFTIDKQNTAWFERRYIFQSMILGNYLSEILLVDMIVLWFYFFCGRNMDCWWLAEVRQSLSHHDEVHHWITKKVRYSTVQGLLRLQSMNYELFKSSLPVIRNPPKSPNFLNVGGFFYTFMMVQEVMFYHGYHGKTATQRGRSFSIGNSKSRPQTNQWFFNGFQ